jgi:hypothetical protein
MTGSSREPSSRRLFRIKERLRRERPEADALELDRAKLRAIRQASRREASRPREGNKGFVRSGRILSVVLAVALLGGGTAVFAATGGFRAAGANSSAATNQYCPPTSPKPGDPKKPGPSKCGKATISVRMRVSNRHPRRRHYVRFFGTVRPALDGRFVYIQRRGSNGRWYVVAKIKLRHFTSTRSKYSRRILVMRKGVYRARVPANSRRVSGTDPNTAGYRRGTSRRKHLIVRG